MDMASGKMKKKSTREAIEWTRRKAWEFTNGLAGKYTKESFEMIFEKATDSFTDSLNWANNL
jgi:hypothetical protein